MKDLDVKDLDVKDLDVIDDAAAARAALDPTRATLLAALAEPGSATTLAHRFGLARQQVNYHLRVLEEHGLVRLVETRPRRGLSERMLVASARSYVISPTALGDNAADPTRTDRLSTRYLVAIAARMLREVGELARRADRAGQALPTLTIDTEIRFANASDRAAFTAELADTVQRLAARYHDEAAPRGRWHRLVVAAHPTLPSTRHTDSSRATADAPRQTAPGTTTRATATRATNTARPVAGGRTTTHHTSNTSSTSNTSNTEDPR